MRNGPLEAAQRIVRVQCLSQAARSFLVRWPKALFFVKLPSLVFKNVTQVARTALQCHLEEKGCFIRDVIDLVSCFVIHWGQQCIVVAQFFFWGGSCLGGILV